MKKQRSSSKKEMIDCPGCERKARVKNDVIVNERRYSQCYCPRCKMRGPIRKSPEKAIHAWNLIADLVGKELALRLGLKLARKQTISKKEKKKC